MARAQTDFDMIPVNLVINKLRGAATLHICLRHQNECYLFFFVHMTTA